MIAFFPLLITPSVPALSDREPLGKRQRKARRKRGGAMLNCMNFFSFAACGCFQLLDAFVQFQRVLLVCKLCSNKGDFDS